MSNLCSVIEFIQKFCLEVVEINIILKEIDEINQENSNLKNELEELDREHVRLQIELYNLETIISHNDISSLQNFHQTSIQMYKDSVELHNLIEKINFAKILQCYHIEMEAKCRNEWQPIQDCFLKTLKWHKEMGQRHIVQKYHQAEVEYLRTEEASKNQQEIIKISLKQSFELVVQAKESRNELIVLLIKGSKDLNAFKAKMKKLNQYRIYIQNLRNENFKIRSQLEQTHLKASNPLLSLSTNNISTTNLESNTETFNHIMPTLPSFNDILKSFNQSENVTNLTAIENINFCVKSILRTSNCKQSITTKQTKNVRFKVQLEEYQGEITQNLYNNEFESETDIEIEVLPTQKAIKITNNQEEKENVPEKKDVANKTGTEIVDLLTPEQNTEETLKKKEDTINTLGYNSTAKHQTDKRPLIEIQDCIVFKTPYPIQELSGMQDRENVLNSIKASCSKQSIDTYNSNSLHSGMQQNTKKSFYDEFLNDSPFIEDSPIMEAQSNNNECSVLKNFDTFFNDKEFLLAYKELNEDIKINETRHKIEPNKTTITKVQEFVDFGPDKGFNFDSDDMTDSCKAGNMDFM